MLLQQAALDRPDIQRIGQIIHRGKLNGAAAGGADGDAESPALTAAVHRHLRDELTGEREFHQLAGLGWIAVDGITVAGDQIAVGGLHQPKRTAKMGVVFVDHCAGARIGFSCRGSGDRVDRIVIC